jgi:hypothetical protein
VKTVLAIIVGVGALAQGAHAQNAGQWRVEAGGNGRWKSPITNQYSDFIVGVSEPCLAGGHDPRISAVGFVGSARVRELLNAVTSGVDCVDVITIGDSNTGFGEQQYGYGYHSGIQKALALVANQYATPLYPALLGITGSSGISDNIFGAGVQVNWPAHNAAGHVGVVQSLVFANASGVTSAKAVISLLNINTLILPKSFGYSWQSVFVPSGNYQTSDAVTNVIVVNSASPLHSAGAEMQYRVVYAKVPESGGRFKLGMWSNFSATFSDFKSADGGSVASVVAESYDFNAPAQEFRCGWDGLGYGPSTYATGPLPILAHSVMRKDIRGFAFNNLMYDSGSQTSALADRLEGMGTLLDEYLREIIARQVAARGSGNAIIQIFSGINGADTAISYTLASQRIVDRIGERWLAVGGDADKLAFVFVPTHPVVDDINGWDTGRDTVVAAAHAWVQGQTGVTIFDIGEVVTTAVLSTNNWYSAQSTQAHLTESGYAAIGSAFIRSLLNDCSADMNIDGIVNSTDLGVLLGAWGQCTGDSAADLDANGFVGGTDLCKLLDAWGVCSN